MALFQLKECLANYSLPRLDTMMDFPQRHKLVKIKTIDGITLEAWFYESEGPAAAVVMSHGVSSLTACRALASSSWVLVQLCEGDEPSRDGRGLPFCWI